MLLFACKRGILTNFNNIVSQGLLQHAVGPVYVVPRKYVEAAETRLDTVPSSPADVTPKAIDDIKGVEEVPVDKAKPEVVEAIETKIDPDRQWRYGKSTEIDIKTA